MTKHVKYILSLNLILAAFASGEFYANENAILDDAEEDRNDELVYEQTDDFIDLLSEAEDSGQEPSSISDHEVTPKATKICHYSFFGEMLYLKPYYQGMTSVIFDDSRNYPALSSSSTTSRNRNLDFKTFDMDFDFGFRVGAGFKTSWLGLENQLIWMSFHGKTHHTYPLGIPFTQNYGTPWANSFTEPCGTGYKISYKTKIHWDQIDLFSKIPLKPLHRLTISPKLGVRGLISKIHNEIVDIKTNWGCVADALITTPPQNTQTTKLKQDFNAIGLLSGFDTDLDFGKGFHFDTLFNASLVFGEIHAKNDTSTVVLATPPSAIPTTFLSNYNFYLIRPIIDAQFLLSWKKDCFRNKVGFSIYAGYEVHYMPNFLHMDRLSDINSEILEFDFSMQGLTAGMGISF